MNTHVLHRFNEPIYSCYDTYLLEGQQDILGVLISTPGDTPAEYNVSLSRIDLQKQTCENTRIYIGTNPSSYMITDMILRYDAVQQRWVMALLHGTDYISICTLTVGQDGKQKLSPLGLLDRDESDRGMNPLLDLEINAEVYTLLYHKAIFEHISAPQVHKMDLVLQMPEWDNLAETEQYQPHARVVLPEQVYIDPGRIHAVQSATIRVINQAAIAEAENAMIVTNQQIGLLVLCVPEGWVVPRMNKRASSGGQIEEQWRLWLTGWASNWTTHQWTYSPDMGLPADAGLPAWEYPRWPTVEVAAVAGPATQQQHCTFVVAMTMHNEEENVLLNQGVCLSQDGEVLQVCSSSLGRYPVLCCCEQMAVGVDRFEEKWRLWNWSVLNQQALQTIVLLDVTCQRAFVYAEPNSGRFWLVEELTDGVRVTHRDANTLAELTSAAYFLKASLLPSLGEERPLNGYLNVGLLPYQQTLLLLVQDEKEGLVLYQVQ